MHFTSTADVASEKILRICYEVMNIWKLGVFL